jgi:2-keto-4-pentenoate hydratase/2-oxohepta-3-ene-1,7-dioic acid hydratase in catechol pathway
MTISGLKWVRYRRNGQVAAGLATPDGIIDVTRRLDHRTRDPLDLIALRGADQVGRQFGNELPDYALDEVEYLPPIGRPGKIICVGVNYINRNAEYADGSSNPKYPSLFVRSIDSLVGHGQSLLRPAESEQLDYEGEIAMVIGVAGRRIAAAQARSHVFGLTLMNEGTIRDWVRHGKFNVTPGKNFDASGAIGPWIVPEAMFGDFSELTVETRVNGAVRQQGRTSDLMFSFEDIIAYISTFTTVHPGDIIATGTPPGAGARLDPPQFLKPGDRVEIESPEIGTLSNSVIDEDPAQPS